MRKPSRSVSRRARTRRIEAFKIAGAAALCVLSIPMAIGLGLVIGSGLDPDGGAIVWRAIGQLF